MIMKARRPSVAAVSVALIGAVMGCATTEKRFKKGQDLIRRLAVDRGKTVLVTLHNLNLAVKYAEAMVFMKKGRVVASGRPGEVLSEDLLRSVYEIEMSIVPVGGRTVIVR
jgi:ABC-type cobalamin/Fe3+-siderophores transport system ATPase subunit